MYFFGAVCVLACLCGGWEREAGGRSSGGDLNVSCLCLQKWVVWLCCFDCEAQSFVRCIRGHFGQAGQFLKSKSSSELCMEC